MIDYEAAYKATGKMLWFAEPEQRTEHVEAVLVAALGNEPKFVWCPDCNGEGRILTMAPNLALTETIVDCERCEHCVDLRGMVQIWPKMESDVVRGE